VATWRRFCIHRVNRVNSQWLCHDDSTINIVIGIIIFFWVYVSMFICLCMCRVSLSVCLSVTCRWWGGSWQSRWIQWKSFKVHSLQLSADASDSPLRQWHLQHFQHCLQVQHHVSIGTCSLVVLCLSVCLSVTLQHFQHCLQVQHDTFLLILIVWCY